MKNLISLALVFFVLWFLNSCAEKNAVEPVGDEPTGIFEALSSMANAPTDTHGSIVLQSTERSDQSHGFALRGRLYSGPTPQSIQSSVSGGAFSLGSFNANVKYYNSLPYYEDAYLEASYEADFGTTVNFNLAGTTAFPAIQNHAHYLPKTISLSIPNASKSTGLVLNWNSDPNNPSGMIGVRYYYDYQGHGNDDPSKNLPVNNDYNRPDNIKIIPDNGSHTLTSAELANFPAGAKIDVQLVRVSVSYAQGVNTLKYVALNTYTTSKKLALLQN